MEHFYSNREYVDIKKALGAYTSNDNAHATARAYAVIFSDPRQPNAKTLRRVVQRMLETGKSIPRLNKRGCQPTINVV